MGVGKSKQFPISYEDACKRVKQDVLTRLEETFKRTAPGNGYLPQVTFSRDVLGETVPTRLAEAIFHAFGGTQKGVGFRDLVCGLVLLQHGTRDEKAKFLAQLLAVDGEHVTKETLEALIVACDLSPSQMNMETLFPVPHEPYCSMEHFQTWIMTHTTLASFSRWLLEENETGFRLEGDPDPPTFYQTLADRYQVTQKEVMDLERTYWGLKGSGKFDLNTFEMYASPPVPKELCEGLFSVFDVNCDSHIDLSEMVNAVALCCRRPDEERHRMCFEVFDRDCDGLLNHEEFSRAVGHLLRIREENSPPQAAEQGGGQEEEGRGKEEEGRGKEEEGRQKEEEGRGKEEEGAMKTEAQVTGPEAIVEAALSQYGKHHEGSLTMAEYVEWAKQDDLSLELMNVMFEVCHIRFGLRPQDKKDEARVVGGYLLRFLKKGKKSGDTVYLITAKWFKAWKEYTGYQLASPSLSTHISKKSKKKKSRRSKHQQMVGPPLLVTSTPVEVVVGGPGGEKPAEEGEEALELIDVVHGPDSHASGVSLTGSEASSIVMEEDTRPGPIDNSDLCIPEPTGAKKLPSLTNEGGKLVVKHLLVEGDHFVLLPEMIWKVFTSWYSTVGHSGGPALPRVISDDGSIDFYPTVFKIYRHTTLPPPIKASSLPWPIASIFGTLGFVGTPQPAPPLITGGVVDSNPTQPPMPRRVAYYQAAFEKNTTVGQISEHLQRILHVKSEDLRVYDFSNEEDPALLEDETATTTEMHFSDGQKLLVETRNKDNSWPEEIIAIMKEVKARDKDKEKPKTQDVLVPPGASGLSNLGNTCFMNSALQCVSNAQPLTQYFKQKDYLLEINKENPLGMGGVMAKRYGELLHDLWNGSSKSITPLKFRFTVGRCAPRFNGFQQQDAQELLAFVLDGLHEDLNRVKEKPYKELKDSDGRPDEEVAKEAWDYHLSRNRSIIVDLFQGQLKSVVRCTVCNYQSVRFDPFTFLSLPLPMESTVNLEAVVVRLDGSQPVRYGLKLEMDDKYRSLKQSLSDLCGISGSRLLLVEVYGAMIRSFPADRTKIRSVLGGWLYAYEIPGPPPLPPTTRSESPDEIRRQRKFNQLKRQRTLSIRKIHEEKDKAARARAKRDKRKKMQDEREAEAVVSSREDHKESAEKRDSVREDSTEPQDTQPTPTARTEGEADTEPAPSDVIQPPSDVLQPPSVVVEPPSDDVVQPPSDVQQSDPQQPTSDSHQLTSKPQPSQEPQTEKPSSATAEEESQDFAGGATHSQRDISPTPKPKSDPRGLEDTDEFSNQQAEKTEEKKVSAPSPPAPVPSPPGLGEQYVFAVHRKIYTVDHYYVASQKNRPVLFGIPLVVPCSALTPRREVYEAIWAQVKRLIIPDPPGQPPLEERREYPFHLKLVGKDGIACATCPWYKFCRGCAVPCDEGLMGRTATYVAVDWDLTALHLKYQQAQERAVDHDSMESLKMMDTDPIDLYQCLKAFVRDDELGEEECWYCKQCKKHQEAVKSLEIWRLPPVLIIHLKRFQFFNGRWVKSQRIVRFPAQNLNPMRYTSQNGNPENSESDPIRTVDTAPVSLQVQPEVHGPGEGQEKEKAEQEEEEGKGEQEEEEGEGEREEEEEGTDHGTGDQEQLEEGVPGNHIAETGQQPEGETEVPSVEDKEEAGTPVYNLFAITCHSGVLGGGHYTSFAKNPNGKWYYFNDSACKETTEERVSQESPYMLFYELRGLEYDHFRAEKQGKRQDIGNTEDDKMFDEALKGLRSRCCIQ